MLKRTLIVLSMTIALVVAAQPLRKVHGILMTEAEVAMNSADAPALGNDQAQEGRGNSFLTALKAPFKAIGRLFGRGKKNKLERISEKDIKKFQSAPSDQIKHDTDSPSNSPESFEVGANSHLEKGRALLNAGQVNEAITELSLATSTESNRAEAYNLLGIAYKNKGLTKMARSSFENALKISKNDAQTLNNLGFLLFSMSDFRGALEPLKKAARLAPNDPRILNNLAMTQSQLGKFDDAAKNFIRAGGEVNGRLNIARRLELAGHKEEAIKNYEAARKRAQAEEKADPGGQSITVLMEIQNGRVIFASVTNHRPGMEAYEASALRQARQRRYPADKNGQESVVVRVSPILAS
jgi:Flp pilus assembly protein TadD